MTAPIALLISPAKSRPATHDRPGPGSSETSVVVRFNERSRGPVQRFAESLKKYAAVRSQSSSA